MRKCRVALAFLIVLVVAVGVAANAAAPPTAGSFLKQRVYTVGDLVHQVSADKIVTSRYTQHFRSNQPTLVAYFRDNLKLSTLHKPTVTTVFYINKAGKIVRGKRLLPTGTPVFVTKSGEVVLDGRCGNPLRADLPRPSKVSDVAFKQPEKVKTVRKSTATAVASTKSNQSSLSPIAPVTQAQAPAELMTPVVEKVLGNAPTEVAALPFASAPVVATEAVAPTVISATPMVPPPAVEAVATAPTTALPPVVSSGGSKFNFLPWAIIGGLGAAAGISGGGGHDNPPPPEQPVPEPSGVFTIASGMMGVTAYAIRRRRK